MKTNGSGQSTLLLLNVIDILIKKKVPYAVVGALAASFYGVVRASMDADAIISLTAESPKAAELAHIFHKSGLYSVYREGDYNDPLSGVIEIKDKYGNRVDLITGIKGMDEDVFMRTTTTTFLKRKIRFVGIEDFIAMKIFSGSLKDIEDARGVLKVSRKSIDVNLLKRLTQNYGKKAGKILKSLL